MLGIISMFVVVLIVLQTYVYVAESQKSFIQPFRDLKVVIYGKGATGKKINDAEYSLDLYANNMWVCTTPMPALENEFRVDEYFSDYMDPEDVFKKDLKVNIFFVKKTAKLNFTVYTGLVNLVADQQIDVKPLGVINSTFQIIHLIFTLACYNYTGYNCEYPFKEDNKYHTDFDTGDLVCKRETDCVEIDKTCVNDTMGCMNGGQCYLISDTDIQYCICQQGYIGERCEFEEIEISEDDIEIDGKDEMCLEKNCTAEEEKKCQNEGQCRKIGIYVHCLCNNTRYSGQFCEHECTTPCIGGYCTHDFSGAFCNSTIFPELENAVPLKYGKNKQDILKFGVFGFFTIMILFSILYGVIVQQNSEFEKISSINTRRNNKNQEKCNVNFI